MRRSPPNTERRYSAQLAPIAKIVGAVAGTQQKLLVRRVGDRYFDGEADEERRERYKHCEAAVAHDLLEYREQRVVQHPAATREDHSTRHFSRTVTSSG